MFGYLLSQRWADDPFISACMLPRYRFARDATLLQRVGQVLLQHPSTQNPKPLPPFKPRWLVAKDAFAMADPAATQASSES
jgi:hypothetical protein